MSPKYKPADDVEGVPTNIPVSLVNISKATDEDSDAEVEFINTVWS